MTFSHNQPEYSVSEIAGHVKRMVEDTFGFVRVRGELSKVGINSASGHAYITMKDDKAVLDAVCWKGTMAKLAHKPEAGMEVIATGRLTTYPGASKYQLIIESLEPAGVGALMAMLEKRKRALEAEGLFRPENKKPIPFLPETIGIITSPTGAVIRDMLHRIGERFARHVLLWPVPVQGQGAAEKIAAAIEGFNALPVSRFPQRGEVGHVRHSLGDGGREPERALDMMLAANPSGICSERPHLNPPHLGKGMLFRPDLIIVARGGGSIEDLWAFNEEIVVRAAANSSIPLISAVGHETDTTLIDYASDKRAPTPTAAAELAVPVRAELLTRMEQLHTAKTGAMRKYLGFLAERIEGLSRGLPRPQQLVAGMEQQLDGLSERLQGALPRSLQLRHEKLERLAAGLSPRLLNEMLLRQQQRIEYLGAMLESLNVLSVLKRGFALVKDAGGKVVQSASMMPAEGTLRVQFHDGERMVVAGNAAPVAAATSRSKKLAAPQPSLFGDD